ncbi:MAG TPA: hypothetical protein VFL90_10190 [Methylomirabilota bacterium]|nr:hypothetical protein [Methylomirabilota bacterium]
MALLLVAGLVLIFCVPARWGRVAGMAVVSLLFLTRGSLWPALPAVLGYLLATSRTWRERLGLLVAATAVPLAFFASDPRHLKVIAYVPVVRPLVAPLGYVPVFRLIGHESFGARAQLLGVVRMLRMYEFWTLAAALLLAFALGRRSRGGPPLPPPTTLTRLVGAFFVFIFVTHLPAYGDRFREMAAYLASFSPLVALLLGVGFARVVTWTGWGRWTRTAVIAALAVVLVAPSIGPDRQARPLADLDRAAVRLRELIPGRRARVPVRLLAAALPRRARSVPARQIHDPNSLAAVDNPVLIQRNGLWGLAEIEAWLGRDAECAVIVPAVLEQFRRSRPQEVAAIEAALRERFQRVARVDDYRWWPMEVYVRKRS